MERQDSAGFFRTAFGLPVVALPLKTLFHLAWAWGADGRGGAAWRQRTDLRGPSALLVGNEGSGLPNELIAEADAQVTIPLPGAVESLNAAIAGSVLLYEAMRQRKMKHEPV